MLSGERCVRCDLALSTPLDDMAVRRQWSGVADVGRPSDEAMATGGPNDSAYVMECPDCPSLTPALHRVVAAFDYQWPGDLLIQRLKLQGRFSCAPILARIMADRLDRVIPDERPGPLVVTAVPASRASILLRGYNPAAELARALARRMRLPWMPSLLGRAERATRQKDLDRQARRREVQGLYHATPAAAGRCVIVVDDVMTTGSTLDAVASALAEHAAAQVWGAVAARTGTPASLRALASPG